MTETPPTDISETQALTQMITAVCHGHDTLTIGFALSTVLADLLIGEARQQAQALRGMSRRTQRAVKRHYLDSVKAALRPLDEVP